MFIRDSALHRSGAYRSSARDQIKKAPPKRGLGFGGGSLGTILVRFIDSHDSWKISLTQFIESYMVHLNITRQNNGRVELEHISINTGPLAGIEVDGAA